MIFKMAANTECCEIDQTESEQGHEGGGVAEDAGKKEVERSVEQNRKEKEEEDEWLKAEKEKRERRERERQERHVERAARDRESYMDRVRWRQAGWQSDEEEDD